VTAELRAIFDADQRDRRGKTPPDMVERDHARRRRALEMIEAGEVIDGADHYHAAMVFQHGDQLDDYWRAHELALEAAELGHRPGRWLAAAAYDRWLTHQGRPQKYGTQYHVNGDRWELYPVEPATTDGERAEWDVPSLAEAHRRAEKMSAERPAAYHANQTPLWQGAKQVASFEVPGLALHVMATEHSPPGSPLALKPVGNPPEGSPWLPEGLTISATTAGGCAGVDADGSAAVYWQRAPAPAGQPFKIGLAQGIGVPRFEELDLDGKPAILLMHDDSAHNLFLLRRASEKEVWLVTGSLPRYDLVRVAASLPQD
jgi:hypothetical protein